MKPPTPPSQSEVCVIGGGSGGFAAALAAARLGASVTLIEKHDVLGGNATRCGVNTWEAVAGATGIPFDLYQRVRQDHGPSSIGIYTIARHSCYGDRYPGGEFLIDRQRTYLDTLQRAGTSGWAQDGRGYRELCHGVPFEPDAVAATMLLMLREAGVDVRLNTAFSRVIVHDRRIDAVHLTDGTTLRARVFIDATADVWVAQAAGCATVMGQESRATYDEPGAPPEATQRVNGVTLLYRITPKDTAAIDPCEVEAVGRIACFNQYPDERDFNVNMLPTMEGEQAMRMLEQSGYQAVYEACRERVRGHWRWVQEQYPEFRRYRIRWIAPGLGVRESHRVIAEVMLTEHDVRAGLARQRHEDIIAIADHPLDTHGAHHQGVSELPGAFGVPLGCLIPKGMKNLWVACRGAGFSSIAASSCRLSRTMMQLGQAAGTAAVLGRDAVTVRASLREQGVQLEAEMGESVAKRLMR